MPALSHRRGTRRAGGGGGARSSMWSTVGRRPGSMGGRCSPGWPIVVVAASPLATVSRRGLDHSLNNALVVAPRAPTSMTSRRRRASADKPLTTHDEKLIATTRRRSTKCERIRPPADKQLAVTCNFETNLRVSTEIAVYLGNGTR